MSLLDNKFEYVYLLEEFENNNSTGRFKIGKTINDANLRLNQLKTGNSRKLELISLIKVGINQALNLESRYHDLFDKYNIKEDGGTEWFYDPLNYIRNEFNDHGSKENLKEFNDYSNKLFDFENDKHKEQFEFIRDEVIPLSYTSNVIVMAPPKSGKRKMVQAMALLTPFDHHIYVVAMDSNSMKVQFVEFDDFNINHFSMLNQGKDEDEKYHDIKSKIDYVSSSVINLSKTGKVFIHFDELDYGSHKSGTMAKFFEKIGHNNENIKYIVYSATPEEAIFSDGTFELAIYKPSVNYNGPSFFINNNLNYKAEEFFTYDSANDKIHLTSQACQIIQRWQLSNKKFVVLRLYYSINKKTAFSIAEDKLQEVIDNYIKSFYSKDPNIDLEFINQENQFDWFYKEKKKARSPKEDGSWKKYINKENYNKKTLLVINAMCSRSTEVGFHPEIFAWHDYRKLPKSGKKASTSYGTYAQAIGRVFHYYPYKDEENCFKNKDTKIEVYCDDQLLEIIDEIYKCKNKNEMIDVWAKFVDFNRDPGIRSKKNKIKQNFKLHWIPLDIKYDKDFENKSDKEIKKIRQEMTEKIRYILKNDVIAPRWSFTHGTEKTKEKTRNAPIDLLKKPNAGVGKINIEFNGEKLLYEDRIAIFDNKNTMFIKDFENLEEVFIKDNPYKSKNDLYGHALLVLKEDQIQLDINTTNSLLNIFKRNA